MSRTCREKKIGKTTKKIGSAADGPVAYVTAKMASRLELEAQNIVHFICRQVT